MTESQFEVERALEDVPMLSSEDSESVLGLTIWTPSATGVKSPDEWREQQKQDRIVEEVQYRYRTYRRLQEICSPDITDHTMTEFLPSAAELKKSLFNGLANLAQTLMISQQLGNGSLAMDELSVLEYVDRIRQMTDSSEH